jgi:hypothetical protein
MDAVIERARVDLAALQAGGVDAAMFSNGASLPYLTHAQAVTAASMARVIGELMPEIESPSGSMSSGIRWLLSI